MTLNVVQITVIHGTTAGSPQVDRFEVGEPYVRWISARTTNAGAGQVSFRLSQNNNTLAPVPGVGKTPWLLMLAATDWDEFRKLSGPNYEFILESYNTDGATDFILQLLIETAKTPNYPVNVLNDPSAPTHKQPTTANSGT